MQIAEELPNISLAHAKYGEHLASARIRLVGEIRAKFFFSRFLESGKLLFYFGLEASFFSSFFRVEGITDAFSDH